jgi:hypothetical protein
LERGPLCRFAVGEEKNIVKGSIHHSIADGRSMEVLLEAIRTGVVQESTKAFSVRKYAALEASTEMVDKYTASAEDWKRMLGDTPPRLEVDFAPNSSLTLAPTIGDKDQAESSSFLPHNSAVTLDAVTVTSLQSFCREKGISMFSAALSNLYHSMRAYSREVFAVGVAQFWNTVGMFVNTVGAFQRKERRWTRDRARSPSTLDEQYLAACNSASMGYGCNVYLAFNVGILGKGADAGNNSLMNVGAEDKNSMDSTMPHCSLALDDQVSKHNTMNAKFDSSASWSEAVRSNSPGDELTVSFESGIGEWPGLEDHFLQVLDGLLDLGQDVPPPALLPIEKSQVLEWGQGDIKPLREDCLHELFEKQARARYWISRAASV